MEKITFLDEKYTAMRRIFYKHRYPEMKQKYNILKSIQPTDFNQLVRFFSFLTVTED